MRDKDLSSPSVRRLPRTALAIVAAGLGLAAIYSCSLIVETRSQQCQADADCTMAGFPNSKCDTMNGVCVMATGSSGSGSSGSSTGSSSSGVATCTVGGTDPNLELLNACTDGGCTPFNNLARIPAWDGGELPPLNDAGPDGGM
jgi:hypothetical protein